MRPSGGCTMQQSLTPEAATVVKQAITLARRRGHPQVTPIHVAFSMLVSPTSFLQTACLKSHSHPLQYKALELCFNVALNRLPTTPSHNSPYPAFSNALVAAFKRAQAHQRRGSIENQQQPILALKIETQQLVVSILDDPSVSRVMREAGFSSTNIKANVEQVVSFEDIIPLADQVSVTNEDLSAVISSLAKKKKNTIVVGECVGSCEAIIRVVKDKIERNDVPHELKNADFMSISLISMKNLSREEIEFKIGEIICVLKGRSVVLYLGDLNWVCEYWGFYGDRRRSFYCPIEHMLMGIRRIKNGENSIQTIGKLTLLGVANFSSYTKCKRGSPSLETILDLHPLSIPVGTLDLSLKLHSTLQGNWSIVEERTETRLTCCSDCSANFHREAQYKASSVRNMESATTTSATSSLPSWLQKCKQESIQESKTDDQKGQSEMKELCSKWNSICSSLHQTINFSSSASPSTSISSHDRKSLQNLTTVKIGWPAMFESRWPSKEHNFLISIPSKPDLLSNPNSIPNSATSSEATDTIPGDFNVESICSALEKRVPWQKDVIPDIARTILKCRSGLVKRKDNRKRETWLFFLGGDDEGKVKIGKELAKAMFGSQQSFKILGLIMYSSPTKADSSDVSRNKRVRDEGFLERFGNAVRDDPHRVFYVEDVEQFDCFSRKEMKRAIQSGMIRLGDGEMVSLEDAIVIFSCESFNSTLRASSPRVEHKLDDDDQEEDDSSLVKLDLNLAVGDDSISEFHILEYVDKQILFKTQMLL